MELEIKQTSRPSLLDMDAEILTEAHREAAVAVLSWLKGELPKRTTGELKQELGWEPREDWYEEAQREKGVRPAPFNWTGNTARRLREAIPFINGLRFGLRVTGLGPGFAPGGKPGIPNLRDEIMRMTAQEIESIARIYQQRFYEALLSRRA